MPTPDRRELAAIFAGGAPARLLRVWLGTTFAGGAPGWPWVTFAINVSGSFALAYLATRLQERLPQSSYRRPLLGTGFCGAYTTFSTMQVEILKIARPRPLRPRRRATRSRASPPATSRSGSAPRWSAGRG